MSKNIYKYVGPAYLDKVIGGDSGATLKCSYPKDFNDPYELFLTIDFNERPDALAFYADAVGEIPQLPTTCFSRSPIVTPMWAHYASNLQGFAIEFDEKLLAEAFPESGFGDIDYQDAPSPELTDMLYRAFTIGKPRYVYFLHKGVFSAAYYTKASCWSYEQERRMVVKESETRLLGDLVLMDVPKECITALICGPRASPATSNAVREKANKLGCDFYEMRIGKVSPQPFFIGTDGKPFVFSDAAIEPAGKYCSSCKEPLVEEVEHCSWCQINDAHRSAAAARNPYRVFAHFGMLDSYIEGMEAISHGAHQSKRGST